MSVYLSRRNFVKLALGAGAGISLVPVIKGCTTLFSESRKEVEEIEWDANPNIPVPENGCYTGFNIKSPDVPIHTQAEKSVSGWFA